MKVYKIIAIPEYDDAQSQATHHDLDFVLLPNLDKGESKDDFYIDGRIKKTRFTNQLGVDGSTIIRPPDYTSYNKTVITMRIRVAKSKLPAYINAYKAGGLDLRLYADRLRRATGGYGSKNPKSIEVDTDNDIDTNDQQGASND